MKTTLFLLLAAVTAGAATTGEVAIPEAFPSGRYQALMSKSPFALATAVVPLAAPDHSFAEGWYLSGISHFDGKDFVSIRSRDGSVQFSLHGDAPNTVDGAGKGIKLRSVEWSPLLGSTSATLEKDGQIAKVPQLDQMESASMGGVAPQMNPVIGMPRSVMPNAGMQGPGGGGAPRTIPQPIQRNIIPRPSTQPVPQQPAYSVSPGLNQAGVQRQNPAMIQQQPGGVPAPAVEGRRRIRVINSAPTQ